MAYLEGIIPALRTMSVVCGSIPVVGEDVKSAAELASKICEHVQKVKENREGYEQLCTDIATLVMGLVNVLWQTEIPWNEMGDISDALQDLYIVLGEIDVAVRKRIRNDYAHRLLPTRDLPLLPFLKKATKKMARTRDQAVVDDMRQQLQDVVDDFMTSSLICNEMSLIRNEIKWLRTRGEVTSLHELAARMARYDARPAERSQDIALLDSLDFVKSAAWNATGIGADASENTRLSICLPGTRVSILKDLLLWSAAPDSPCVFWLNGMAGTGKSTIARTLCERLQEQGLLGASFFISRDHPERRDTEKIVHSISHQLASKWRSFSHALCANLRGSALLGRRSLQQQITDLIITPARELPDSTSFIIVIDALDECSTDFLNQPGGEFLSLLVSPLHRLNGRLRLCLTSRNNISIQGMFRRLPLDSWTVLRLNDLDKTVVHADIVTYLDHSFEIIRESRRDLLLEDWPTAEAVHELARLSGMLFIYAVNAVRFLAHPKYNPRQRLTQLLEPTSNAGTAEYRELYSQYELILNDAVRYSDSDDACWKLRAVMATMILGQAPLRLDAIATLSGVDDAGARVMIRHLWSLLADSTDGIRVVHPQSFLAFAVDSTRCNPRLCVVPNIEHGAIALRCLALMNDSLRYDICHIRDPKIANKDVQNLNAALLGNVSDALCYATRFWSTHLAASGAPDHLLLNALNTFCQDHLFHWVEVLSLVGHVVPAETPLLRVLEWCEKHPSATADCAKDLLRDLARLLLIYATPIRSHALHVYHSVFVTMPKCQLLKTLTEGPVPSGIARLVSSRAASLRVLEGHSNTVHCVAYSPHGSHIVSGSYDHTVRVWDTVIFEELAKLEGHQDRVRSVAFSPDATRIVSGSNDRTLRIWSTVTFKELAKLEGHQDYVNCVAFSPDSTYIVSGSSDRTVRVWSAVTCGELVKLKGHQYEISSVSFSPGGAHIVSGSYDNTLRVWNAITFEELAKLEGHQDFVSSVAFSPDGTQIVSGSLDSTMRVWNAVTFKELAKIEGHRDLISSVAFSPDGTQIVSGCYDSTVRVWHAFTFKELAKFRGHQFEVWSVAFSPDGTYIVSGSEDNTVRVWNPKSHQDAVSCVTFSPDGTHIVSGSNDCTVRVWNAGIFEELAKLEGHQGTVNCAVFSSDGTKIVSGSNDRTMCVWNAVTFKELGKLEGHQGVVNCAVFSSDGTKIISGSDDRTVCVWNAVTFSKLGKLEGYKQGVSSVACSPDGIHIVSSSYDRTVRVCNAVTFQELAKLDGNILGHTSVSFSHDSKVIHLHDRGRWGHGRAWASSNSAFTAWRAISSDEIPSDITGLASSSDIRIALSDSGWLSCLSGAGCTLLWLPQERRGQAVAGFGSRFVIGAQSGAVTVLELPTEVA